MTESRRIVLIASVLVVLAMVVGAFAVGIWPQQSTARAEPLHQDNPMAERLNQLIEVLQRDPGPAAVEAAINNSLEVLYGGIRPLPTHGEMADQTQQAHEAVGAAEVALALALEGFIQNGRSQEVKGQALDMKLFIEQMHEVAEAVGQATLNCDPGNPDANPDGTIAGCEQLVPLLDELNGVERPVPDALANRPPIVPSYSFKLRGPFVPAWFRSGWNEDVLVTEPIGKDECTVVFKETRGLMLRVHFDRIIIVNDPWVGTFGFPRGTRLPIWTLEMVPSEYVKEFTLCNKKGKITQTVTQRVVQDIALKYFWRFYGNNGKH